MQFRQAVPLPQVTETDDKFSVYPLELKEEDRTWHRVMCGTCVRHLMWDGMEPLQVNKS